MKIKFIKNNKRGIALLFVVMLSSILLVVALSLSNIATKEAVFSTSTRNASDAFYAADTGAECALANDRLDNSIFKDSPDSGVGCLGNPVVLSGSGPWNFTLTGMGSSENSCASVKVEKIIEGTDTKTIITSSGYNKIGPTGCGSNSNNITERVLEVNY